MLIDFAKVVRYDGYWIGNRAINAPHITYVTQHGSVSGPSSAIPGSTVNVSVTPDSGCGFNYITVDGVPIEDTSFIMPEHDVTVTVICEEFNPDNLPAGTIRIKFSDLSIDPRQPYYGNSSSAWYPGNDRPYVNYATWTRVSSNPNIWDFTYNSTIYSGHFGGDDYSGRKNTNGFWTQEGVTFEVISANTSNLTNISFRGNWTKVCLFDTSNMETLQFAAMFNNCPLLTSCARYNTSGKTSFSSMFKDCSSLTFVPKLDTSSATLLGGMFYNCSSLTKVPTIDCSSATEMESMFEGCSSLVEPPVFINSTSSITNISYLYQYCSSLKNATLPNTNGVTHIGRAFDGCTLLEEIPMFNAPNLTRLSYMCYNCTSIKEIPDLGIGQPTQCSHAFDGCVNVESGITRMYNKLSPYATGSVAHAETFKNCGSNTASGSAELAQIPSDWK